MLAFGSWGHRIHRRFEICKLDKPKGQKIVEVIINHTLMTMDGDKI